MAYVTEKLLAGNNNTDQVKFVADTYYNGMPLEYVALNDNYQYLAAGTLAGFYYTDNADGDVLALNDVGAIVNGGKIYEGGIVTDANVLYTMTEDIRAAAADVGLYIQRD